jgi:hypothetical protein
VVAAAGGRGIDMSRKRSMVIVVIGCAFASLQALHLVWVWHFIWPAVLQDCAVSPRWCEDGLFVVLMVGVLPQLFFSTVTLTFVGWLVVDRLHAAGTVLASGWKRRRQAA